MVGLYHVVCSTCVLGAIAAVVATNGFEIFKVYAIYLQISSLHLWLFMVDFMYCRLSHF